MGFVAAPSIAAPCAVVAAVTYCNLTHSCAASAGLDSLLDYKAP